jgi:hypothetical protein
MSIEHAILKAIEEKSMSLNQLINEVSEGNNRNLKEVSKNIYLLMEDGKLKLVDPSPPGSPLGYLVSVYCLWFWGVFISLIFTFLTIFVFPQIPPFTYVRIGLGFLTALYLPGMALIEALYPKKEDLEETERFALSIGLSLALTPLTGFVLNYTPWGIRLEPIIIAITLLTIVLGLTAVYRKYEYFRLITETKTPART